MREAQSVGVEHGSASGGARRPTSQSPAVTLTRDARPSRCGAGIAGIPPPECARDDGHATAPLGLGRQLATVADDARGILKAQRSGHVSGGNLTHAVSQHDGWANPLFDPQIEYPQLHGHGRR